METIWLQISLGWCVVGPLVKNAKKGSISCNKIVVQGVTSGTMASNHFGITNQVKDVSAKEILQRMYNQEFNESKLAFYRRNSKNGH